MSLQIKSADVIRLILQFLKQNKLTNTFETLQQQSQICINMINKQSMHAYIMNNQWDLVLRELKNLLLPEEKLFNLLQLIVEDLLEHDENEAALFVINTFLKPKLNPKTYQQKILRLEYLCEKLDKKELFKNLSKEKKKLVVAESITAEILNAPSERLLKLLGQSVKYQIAQGIINPNIKLDFFTDHKFEFKQEEELLVRSVQKIVKYPEQSKLTVVKFSNKGQYMATGGADGLIQIYDPNNYQVNNKLQYQNQGSFLFHNDTVTSIAFNETDQILSSADKTGQVKIWNLLTGKCLRKIQNSNDPITALSFGIDPAHILIAYQVISLYGLKSAKVLKQFKGHTSYVNAIVLLESVNQMITASKDGSIKYWNYFSQQQLRSYSPSSSLIQVQINNIKLYGEGLKNLMICMKSNTLILSQSDLKTFQNITLQNKQQTFNSWCVSGIKGQYIYSCIQTFDKRWKLNVYNSKTRRVEYFTILENEIYLMQHHPSRNLFVSVSVNGDLSFWRP